MTVKEFFKSKSLKCILALLCVLLVSGIFLTLMNSLLAVSSEERFERAIMKIYGKSVPATSIAVADYNSDANIEEAYKMGDGNYLIKSTGLNGYDNGTVTCWVVVEVSGGKVGGIGKVIIDSSKNQSYISRVGENALNEFVTLYEPGVYYTQDMITGATVAKTKTAICNSVNGALDFVRAMFGDVAEDLYTEFDYIENIQTTRTSHEYNEADGSVTFTVVSKGYGMASDFTSIVTVDSNGRLAGFEVVVSGSTSNSYTETALKNVNNHFMGKNLTELLDLFNFGVDDEIAYPGAFPETGASNSSFSLYNAALFAVANYDKCIPEGVETQVPDVEDGTISEAPDAEDGTISDSDEGGSENE